MAVKLSKKEQLFVNEYIKAENATKAAIAAGYAAKSAHVAGCRLLKKANVKQAIDEVTAKVLGQSGITVQRVLNEIAKLAFFDPRKLFNEDGSPKQIHELDDDTAAAVAGLDVNELWGGSDDGERTQIGVVKKFKLADKGQNLERLGRHLKMFTDKVEATGENGGPIVFSLRKIGTNA